MPTATCKKCSSSNLEQNDAAGSLICTDCGTVCEENQIVVEQAWGTDAGGGSMMIGTFIGNDGISNPVNNVGGQRNSREITLRKAKDSIRHLCAQLRLKDYHIDESYRFYKLALNHNFTRGRKVLFKYFFKLLNQLNKGRTSLRLMRLFILSHVYLAN